MIGKHGLDWASEEEEAKWHVIQLPDRLYYSGGRDEYLAIMEWVEELGKYGEAWEQHILKRILFLSREEDMIAFKLRFGL